MPSDERLNNPEFAGSNPAPAMESPANTGLFSFRGGEAPDLQAAWKAAPSVCVLEASCHGGSAMIRVLTILTAVVALAVSASPASAVNDGTSNTRHAAFTPPMGPATPPGVPIPYPN